MQGAPKVQYIECQRGGYHTGQVLNMVCLQQQCMQQQLCCCACIEENHKAHQTRPLRLVMQEAQTAASQVSPVKFNIDVALELLASHLKQTMETFSKYKKLFINSIQQIQTSLLAHHSLIIEQLKLKNVDPKVEILQAFETVQFKTISPTDYSQAVKKIIGLTKEKKDDKTLTESDILSSLKNNHVGTSKRLHENLEEINKSLQRYLKELNDNLKEAAIWKKEQYKFSPTLKHADVKILENNVVKSTNNSGYKFIIMTPHLESGTTIKKLAFRIKESSSNWVAVGMCHPKVVTSKNYGFNFSSIGHGAYMVSANGGIWSHTKAQHNNSVKAFKFTKGDIIQVLANMGDKIVVFKKNNETYQIPFETIANDELSPCVLFYYLNDQVQFLPDYQE